jgi:hypothetical protein
VGLVGWGFKIAEAMLMKETLRDRGARNGWLLCLKMGALEMVVSDLHSKVRCTAHTIELSTGAIQWTVHSRRLCKFHRAMRWGHSY